MEKLSGSKGLAAAAAAARQQQKEEQRKEAFRQGLKQLGKFLLRFLILVLANTVVLIAGAYLFMYLEGYNEREVCKEQRSSYLEALEGSTQLVVSKSEVLRGQAGVSPESLAILRHYYLEYLENFALEMHKLKYNHTHVCEDLGSNAAWTFSNSLVYSLTIVSTIGKIINRLIHQLIINRWPSFCIAMDGWEIR